MPWVEQWREEHEVPWKCVTCNNQNDWGRAKCRVCGKRPPPNANLNLDDAAASKLQGLYRSRNARALIRALCASVVQKMFDPESGCEYYVNTQTGEASWEAPRLMGDGASSQFELTPRGQLAKEQKLAEDVARQEREEAKEARDAKRDEAHLADLAQAEELKLAEIEANWRPALRAAETSHELLCNWKEFDVVNPKVWEFGDELRVLRLIGNPLRVLPDTLADSLCNLRVLALSNCELRELPENLCGLTGLTDLNLMKNELRELPERFGDLTGLRDLQLSSNRLESLPASFGALSLLPRVNLERNFIEQLPEEVTLLKCTGISLSKLTLRRLPLQLGRFEALQSLTANHNRIRRIPPEIGLVVSLRHLSLCDNQISVIPDELTECTRLERLWLDWNQCTALPQHFLALEPSMKSLHLEGNPMRMPEIDIVIQGVPRVMKWCRDKVEFIKDKNRRKLIERLERILRDVLKHDLVRPEVLEPDTPMSKFTCRIELTPAEQELRKQELERKRQLEAEDEEDEEEERAAAAAAADGELAAEPEEKRDVAVDATSGTPQKKKKKKKKKGGESEEEDLSVLTQIGDPENDRYFVWPRAALYDEILPAHRGS